MANDKYIHELTQATTLDELWDFIVSRGEGVAEVRANLRLLRQLITLREHDPLVHYKEGMAALRNGLLVQAKEDTNGAFAPDSWRTVSGGAGNKRIVTESEVHDIIERHQQFIYGDMTVEGVLNIEAQAQLVMLDGVLLVDGTVNNDGEIIII